MASIDEAASIAEQMDGQMDRRGGGRGGRRGGGRGGRGGRGRGRGGSDRSVDISRALSRLLRHQAANAGITLDPEGYAPLDRVLAWGPLRALAVTPDEVRAVVASNDKQRFALKEEGDTVWIRANQGHSIPLASDGGLLQPVEEENAPAVVCHGTFLSVWPAIEAAGGLRPMGRNHVHCGCSDGQDEDDNDAPVPGLRKNAELLVFLDVRRALRQDPSIRWWRAANGVLLSEGAPDTGVVPTRFFRRVVATAAGMAAIRKAGGIATSDNTPLILWQDGERVADLPAAVLAHARPAPNQRGAGRRTAEAKARERGKEKEAETKAETDK